MKGNQINEATKGVGYGDNKVKIISKKYFANYNRNTAVWMLNLQNGKT